MANATQQDGCHRYIQKKERKLLSTLTFLAIICIPLNSIGFESLFALVSPNDHLNSETIARTANSNNNESTGVEDDSRAPHRLAQFQNTVRHQTISTNTSTGVIERRIVYRATSGLGHRLVRMASAYHLGKLLRIPVMFSDWKSCAVPNNTKNVEIFEYLFGDSIPIMVPHHSFEPTNGTEVCGPYLQSVYSTVIRETADDFCSAIPWPPPQKQWIPQGSDNPLSKSQSPSLLPSNYSTLPPNIKVKTVGATNEVPGYIKVKYYDYTNFTILHSKMKSDAEFYHTLWNNFKFKDMAINFMRQHQFYNHTVFGLHIRAGNGEVGDFTKKRRGIDPSMNVTVWCDRVIQRIYELHAHEKLLMTMKNKDGDGDDNDETNPLPPLLFVATDTESMIEELKNATKRYHDNFQNETTTTTSKDHHHHQQHPPLLKVVHFPQHYVSAGNGVSYNSFGSSDSSCLSGWRDQILDALILGFSDVVVAALYSSFTQAIPLSLAFTPLDLPIVGPPRPPVTTIMSVTNSRNHSMVSRSNEEENIQTKQRKHPKRHKSNYFCELSAKALKAHCYDNFVDFFKKKSFHGSGGVDELVSNENQDTHQFRRIEILMPVNLDPWKLHRAFEFLHSHNATASNKSRQLFAWSSFKLRNDYDYQVH